MSNQLGSIYATTKSAKKYIMLDSENVEVSGNFFINGTNSRMPAEIENSLRDYLPLTYGIGDPNPTTLYDQFADLSENVLKQRKDASFNNVDISGDLSISGELKIKDYTNNYIPGVSGEVLVSQGSNHTPIWKPSSFAHILEIHPVEKNHGSFTNPYQFGTSSKIDTANGWNSSTHKYTIPTSGYWYIHSIIGGFTNGAANFYHYIYHYNSSTQSTIAIADGRALFNDLGGTQFETTGNDASTIRYLNKNDQIWLSCVSFSSGFFGDGGRTDCGFRAYFMRS